MTKILGPRRAFGGPGIEPRWTRGNKDGVGTAYSKDSQVWFTIWNGIITEVYYPTVDTPQLRDLQYLMTDGDTFFHEERHHLHSSTERLSHDALGYKIVNSDPAGRYRVIKEVIVAPHLSCVLQHTKLEGEPDLLSKLKLYALCAPHLGGGGRGNNAHVVEVGGRRILTAEKDGVWLALGASVPFSRLSCGYVGASDGWTDVASNFRMDWQFDEAEDGNVALTGEIDSTRKGEFTLGLALGKGLHDAATTLLQGLSVPYEKYCRRFLEQWERPFKKVVPLENFSGDGGNLYHASYSLILAHEDKTFPGALIASLSIPWGEARGDEDQGGYHLVWTRDMVNSAMGLLAAGNTETPLRALIYLAASQQEDGGFPQNFWLNGEPYWKGVQLDEVAFPIMLARRLKEENLLEDFDPYPMVKRAARYLVVNGPATQQERWEEASGYSPSTLASNIAALINAASFARERGEENTARYLEEYADFLECHIEAWTVTTRGTLLPRIRRHYIRIHPVDVNDPHPNEDPNEGVLLIPNRPPGSRAEFPAKEIVDAGFLQLVRFGIRRPDDPLIVDSVKVVDSVLKVETPYGPCWRRYNHDGYGQREDGGAYHGWGKGRAWPLLTGERGHYELDAGHDVETYIRTMERLASPTGLLPEQVWDEEDRPESHMYLGRPTGSAMPLMWAHAEYIKLLRSAASGKVFALVPEVAKRYLAEPKASRLLEVWKSHRQPRSVRKGWTLRIQAASHFMLHWSLDDWRTAKDTLSTPTGLEIEFVDIHVLLAQQMPIRFTFFWTEADRWEGRDYLVTVE
jgi:glucoamylase